METDYITLNKTLHYLIENFIMKLRDKLDTIDTNKIFSEIIKRSDYITRDLRSSALYVQGAFNPTDIRNIQDHLNDKIESLIQNLLHQDLLEFALSSEEYLNISDCELHIFLHASAMRDVTNHSLSSSELKGMFKMGLSQDTSKPSNFLDFFRKDSNISCLLSSPHFESTKNQFEEELSDIKRIWTKGFSESDLDVFNVATILKYDNSFETDQNKIEHVENLPKEHDIQRLSSSCSSESSDFLFSEIHSEDDTSFLSWEGCLKNSLPYHSYISELTTSQSFLNISEKESQTYYSLLNPYDAISELDMVYDILDLLIGIPSNTFYFDIQARKFQIKSFVHLSYLSSECTARVVSLFMEFGSIYYLLQKFSSDFLHSGKGLVFQGLQQGIKQVLSVYKKYIVAVKANSPSMLFLRSDVLKNAEILQNFGTICGLDAEKMTFNEIPKGLGLLAYLHDIAHSLNGIENGILIAVLLKYTYAPYFSYLNKWMTEGICDDPFGEFQIMEDMNYLMRKDAFYWKFAYTENIDDPTRSVPPEVKKFSQNILDCGKTVRLLKLCCPDLFSLKFLFWKSPPSFSVAFSFSAAVHKLHECAEYIEVKEKAEEIYNETSEISADDFLIKCQEFVKENMIAKNVQRKWNILLSAECNSSNILNVKHIKENINIDIFSYNLNLFNSKKKWSSLNSLTTPAQDFCFSGKLYSKVGILFSSCGYIEMDSKLNHVLENIEDDFSSLDFNRQLCLISYTQLNSTFPQMVTESKWESLSKLEFLNALKSDDRISKLDFLLRTNIKSDTADKNAIQEVSNHRKEKNLVNPFLEKLLELLISEYKENVKDIYSCIQVVPLQRLILHSFNTVLKMRILFMSKTVMKYMVKQLGLDILFSTLRDIYFLQNEYFYQSLCEQLFKLVVNCKTPGKFANWATLNEIFLNAISESNLENNSFLSCINVNVLRVIEEMPAKRTDFLHMFVIEFHVNWPLNIIVHQTCIRQYLKIFSTLLEVEFLCWFIGHIWRKLIICCKELYLDDSPQFRIIMLNRFEMDQFIRIIRNSIHQHLQGPLWEFLDKSLSMEESSIDKLEHIHMQYLEKALARCFLTEETHVLHELISVMFDEIYKFCNAVFECTWSKNNLTGHFETSIFNELSTSFDTFKKCQKIFINRILKEMLTKKFGRYWDKEYQQFLETIIAIEQNVR